MNLPESAGLLLWPILACLLLPWLLVYYGLHVVRRGVIFVDLALAQMAALGHCLAILLGYPSDAWQHYALSVSFTLVGAAIFALTRDRNPRVPQEALIGIVYVVAAAAAILLLSKSAEGKEELQRSLVGDLLLVPRSEILAVFGLFLVIGVLHYLFRRPFTRLSMDHAALERSGAPVRAWDFLFYALFGLVVTAFAHLGGVLLTFSYLIVPAVAANYLASTFRIQWLLGWLLATLASVLSIVVTLKADLPLGAAIVCGLGLGLIAVMAVARFRNRAA